MGISVPRIDGPAKAKGEAIFIDDLKFPGMLYMAIVGSPYSRAEIKEIDISPAMSLPGVVDVITAKDIPGENIVPLIHRDQPFIAEKEVRFYQEPVALVVAESLESAKIGASAVKVKYNPLTPIFDPRESLANQEELINPVSNILKTHKIRKGNVSEGFAKAEVLIERTFTTPNQEHCYLETNGAIALIEDGGVTVYGSMQCPFYVHNAVAKILGITQNKVRVVQTTTGGGFGGKEDFPSIPAGFVALGSFRTGRPVKLVYSREEDIFASSKRHSSIVKVKIGALRSGKMIAIEVEYILDGGAYATLTPVVLWRGTVHAAGPYSWDNVEVNAFGVATNKPPFGAFRGFGSPQTAFAREVTIDELATKLGLSPYELRKINYLSPGDSTATGQVLLNDVNIRQTAEAGIKKSNWDKKYVKFSGLDKGRIKRGIGMSSVYYGVDLGAEGGALNKAGAFVQVYQDGTVKVAVGTTEMGQGMKTVLAQITAQALGISYDKIMIMDTDTSRVPDSGPTVASRATIMSGNAIINACQKIKNTIFSVAAGMLESTPGNLKAEQNIIYTISEPRAQVSFQDVVAECYQRRLHLTAQGWYSSPPLTWDPLRGQGNTYYVYSYATNIAEVEVDTYTGVVMPVRVYCVVDIGKAINPQLAEGQIQGGVLQGLGFTLLEEVVWQEGKIQNPNFSTYILPTTLDAPQIVPVILEESYNEGPFGAKGLGELPLIGVAPAIINAIYNATGVVVRDLPASPEKLLNLIEAKYKEFKPGTK